MMKMRLLLFFLLGLMVSVSAFGQYLVHGVVRDVSTRLGVAGVMITNDYNRDTTFTDVSGRFQIGPLGVSEFYVFAESPRLAKDAAQGVSILNQDVTLDFYVDLTAVVLDTIQITDAANSVNWMRDVEGMGIYAARKCELIDIERVTGNLATNNARQVFARVPGLNIWENDGGGLQLGIGGRGLSPNRSSNFNTRQNGYDIAADALGYPESYYSPPVEALRRIEVVRGAASLQYGTQFGGMVNFQFKEGPQDKKIQLTTRQTAGSYGFFSSFNSLGGQVGKVNYYAFYQGKRGNGWRENAGFVQHTAFGSVKWQLSPRLRLGSEYTFMQYLAQQPGGLTDAMFARDPRQSIRARNWFQVGWNLAAVTADISLSETTKLNLRNFGLLATRDALGFLGPITQSDPGGQRDLITGAFQNFGNETRLMHKFDLCKQPAALLLGARYYQGRSTNRQGSAPSGSAADFVLLHPEQPEGSDYVFPSRNVAGFAELVMHPHPKWTVAPGLRWEYIFTAAQGSYEIRRTDLAGNVIYQATVADAQRRSRQIMLGGIGTAYKPSDGLELYANISRNYRAITFNDMRVVNPNFRIDPALKDEKGFNADLGFRGHVGNWFNFDASAFYLYYRDRIGQVLMTDSTTFQFYRYRTNVSDSRNIGLEWYAEADFMKLGTGASKETRLALFTNIALIDARYIGSQEPAFQDKWVELVPALNLKTGLDFKHKALRANVQWTYVSQQFSDATNAVSSPSAVEGIIPAYQVLDCSAGYTWRWLSLEASGNNLLNHRYFTRRASGYPGPGIIPSDGRSFFVTLQAKI
jgi:Fe(3+) dicitrate transport protein